MSRLLWNQAENLTAVVAAWAILLAPVATFGNCCCQSHAAMVQAADSAQADSDRIAPVSCCASESTHVCVSETTPACCLPPTVATGKPMADAAAQSCACELPCCDTDIRQAPAAVNVPGQQLTSLDWEALPAALLDASPWEVHFIWSERSREPAFLSAHARCAMLCRWLN